MIFVPGEQWYTNGEAFDFANFGTWTPNSNNLEELVLVDTMLTRIQQRFSRVNL